MPVLVSASPRLAASWKKVVAFRKLEPRGPVRFVPVGQDAGLFLGLGPEARVYRWAGGAVEPWPGTPIDQDDRGAGLETFVADAPGGEQAFETRDVRSGKVLSRVAMAKPYGIARVGTTIEVHERGPDGRMASRQIDATTGGPPAPSVGEPVLVGRLALFRQYTVPPGAPYPCYSVLRRGVQEVPVQPFEQPFGGLIGPPEGPIALEFSFIGVGVENYSYSLVSRSFRTLPIRPGTVYDASERGFLVSLGDRGYPSSGPRYPDLTCLDPETGRVRWQGPEGGAATWCGGYAIRGASGGFEALDGATGRPAGRFAAPTSAGPIGGGRFLSDNLKTGIVALWELRLGHG